MKRFDFPLETVRSWRGDQAEVEEVKLQTLFAELAGIDAEREGVKGELSVAQAAVERQPSISATELANLDEFRQFVKTRLDRIARRRAECNRRVAAQRQRVIEARRAFELLDRLKKKALAEWIAARDKEQEELAAELYLAKLLRERQMR